ncbi:DUF4123 domain-containing protein [Pandoraea terrae]|nr:DUF4123 domain-containing protein [Pandoraea terrae]
MTDIHENGAEGAAACWQGFGAHVHETQVRLSEVNAATRLYALVDTRGLSDLRNALSRLEVIQFEALWDETDLSAHKDISPLLIAIDVNASVPDIPLQLLERLWQFSQDDFVVTWIWSSYGLPELTRHFRAHCEYRLEDRRAFYLHYYDNRILEWLRDVWTPEEQHRFASVAFEIWHRKRTGGECVWREAEPQRPQCTLTLEMTNEQHLALLALGIPDKLALQLRELLGGRLAHLSAEALYQVVRDQMERAARYRIRDEGDMLQYVSKGLLVARRFDEHPLIQHQLTLASSGDIPFADVLSKVNDEFVETLATRRLTRI